MPLGHSSTGSTKKLHKCVARLHGACGWTRLIAATASVHLARCDTTQAQSGPFAAPHRPVTVIDAGWRAYERVAGRNDGRSEQGKESDHPALVPSLGREVD
jgi:hypothetical protein